MTRIQIYSLVLFSVTFQHEMNANKIVIQQTDEVNDKLKNLRDFARLGDPCRRLRHYSKPNERSYADDECVAAIKGYVQLPPGAKKRCSDLFVPQTGCRAESFSASTSHYCGVLLKNDKVVRLSYCIENLELLSCRNKWLTRGRHQLPGLEWDRWHQGATVTVIRPHSEDESYLEHFMKFMGMTSKAVKTSETKEEVVAKDPCADLEPIPDAASMKKAEDECMAILLDYRKLPSEAKQRCKVSNIQRVECKKGPSPSEKWCCGLDMDVKTTGLKGCFVSKEKKTVCFSYCVYDMQVRIVS